MGNSLPSQVEEYVAQIPYSLPLLWLVGGLKFIFQDNKMSAVTVQALSGRYLTVLLNNGDNVPLNLKEVRAYGKAGRRFV